MNKPIPILIVMLALALPVTAQPFWHTKPYTQWREKEANQLLLKSPWTYEFQWTILGSISANVLGTGDPEREQMAIVRVHLLSAKPIRQAYASRAARGDSQRLGEFKSFVDSGFPEDIVVTWTLDSIPKGVSAVFELNSQLMSLTVADLQTNTYLTTDTGRKVFIKAYIPPGPDGLGPRFVFPRLADDGGPLLSGGEGQLRFHTKTFVLKPPRQDVGFEGGGRQQSRYVTESRRLVENQVAVEAIFPVRDLSFQGRLEY